VYTEDKPVVSYWLHMNVFIRGRQKMMVCRKKPEIGKTKSLASNRGSDDDSWGCILMPLGIAVAYFVTSAVVHSMYNTARKLEQVICYGKFANNGVTITGSLLLIIGADIPIAGRTALKVVYDVHEH
jgi:hypothetical protein